MSYQIADLRQYFRDRIAEIDTQIEEFETDPFGSDDVSDFEAEKFYKLIIGDSAFSRESTAYIEELSVILELYAARSRDEQANFDTIYQKAIDIKDCVICPETVKNSVAFTEVIEQSLTPSPLGEDDKSIKITLQFNVLRYKKF